MTYCLVVSFLGIESKVYFLGVSPLPMESHLLREIVPLKTSQPRTM